MRNSEFGQPAVTLDLPAGGSSIVGSQSARTTVDDGMNIGAVAERSGVPAKSIRYYESIGLIRPAERRANGYRSYSRNEMQTLAFIEQARRLGFSVDEVRDLLDLWRDRRRKSAAVKKLVAHRCSLSRATRVFRLALGQAAGCPLTFHLVERSASACTDRIMGE